MLFPNLTETTVHLTVLLLKRSIVVAYSYVNLIFKKTYLKYLFNTNQFESQLILVIHNIYD